MDFTNLILQESSKLVELHSAIHSALIHRDRDARSFRMWSDACDAFHSYVSAMDSYFKLACEEPRYSDRELMDFAICFLEVDPRFFRSGYLKQIIITRLKRSPLHAEDKRRLRRVLIDAVNRRGTREFTSYCQLAVVVANPGLMEELEAAISSADSARVSRARLMLKYIKKHGSARRP